MQFTVWLISGDGDVRRRWQRLLARSGWPVALAGDPAALAREAFGRPGLALLNVATLGGRPADAVRELKARARAFPVLLICPQPIPDEVMIAALEAGADDCFPDTMAEALVLAKLNAHLRRILPQVALSLDTVMGPSGDIKLDRSTRQVSVKSGGRWAAVGALSPIETSILAIFFERPGMVIERRFLLESVWRDDAEAVQPGTVDKHVESLRRKLGARGKRIRTVYGSGYLFKDGET